MRSTLAHQQLNKYYCPFYLAMLNRILILILFFSLSLFFYPFLFFIFLLLFYLNALQSIESDRCAWCTLRCKCVWVDACVLYDWNTESQTEHLFQCSVVFSSFRFVLESSAFVECASERVSDWAKWLCTMMSVCVCVHKACVALWCLL